MLKESKDFIERTDIDTAKSTSYAAFYIRRSFFSLYATRRYQKFDDILSYLGNLINTYILGGLLNIIFLALTILVKTYNR